MVAVISGVLVTCLVSYAAWTWQARRSRGQLVNRLRRLEQHAGPVDLLESTAQVRYSHLPALRRLLRRLPITQAIVLWLEQAGSRMNASTYLAAELCAVLVGGLLAAWWGRSSIAVGGCALAAAAVPWAVVSLARRRRLRRLADQLPDAVRMISAALRAGLSLDAGLQLVASELTEPIRTEFRRLLNEAMLQTDVAQAFRRLAQRVPSVDVRLFAAASCLHRDVGGNFTQLLDQLESTIRDRVHLHRELRSLTAESRLTGWVLGILPVAVAAGIAFLSPSYLGPLVTTELGRTLLLSALGLQAAGAVMIWWMLQPRFR